MPKKKRNHVVPAASHTQSKREFEEKGLPKRAVFEKTRHPAQKRKKEKIPENMQMRAMTSRITKSRNDAPRSSVVQGQLQTKRFQLFRGPTEKNIYIFHPTSDTTVEDLIPNGKFTKNYKLTNIFTKGT